MVTCLKDSFNLHDSTKVMICFVFSLHSLCSNIAIHIFRLYSIEIVSFCPYHLSHFHLLVLVIIEFVGG